MPRSKGVALPERQNTQAPLGYATKILHAGLSLGGGVLEGCDAPPGEYKRAQSFCVMFKPKDAAEADQTFSALAEDGIVQIPIRETFLGAVVRHGC